MLQLHIFQTCISTLYPKVLRSRNFQLRHFHQTSQPSPLRNEAWKESRKSFSLARCDPAGYSNAWDDRPGQAMMPSEKRWIPKACEKIVSGMWIILAKEMNDVCLYIAPLPLLRYIIVYCIAIYLFWYIMLYTLLCELIYYYDFMRRLICNMRVHNVNFLPIIANLFYRLFEAMMFAGRFVSTMKSLAPLPDGYRVRISALLSRAYPQSLSPKIGTIVFNPGMAHEEKACHVTTMHEYEKRNPYQLVLVILVALGWHWVTFDALWVQLAKALPIMMLSANATKIAAVQCHESIAESQKDSDWSALRLSGVRSTAVLTSLPSPLLRRFHGYQESL